MLVDVQVVDRDRPFVVPADADVAGREDLAQLVADERRRSPGSRAPRRALLDAVDDRELGVALLGLLQQPLRLVEQARVLERHAHAGGDRLQQAHLGSPNACSRSSSRATIDAEHAVAADDRHDRRRLRACRCPGAYASRRTCRVRALLTTAGCRVRSIVLARTTGLDAVRSACVQPLAVLVDVEEMDAPVSWSYQRMPMSRCSSTSRSLSPTRSTIAWNRAQPAMPCWMLLITASSALRCSVSFNSRCVSSNRRAFSSATPMLAGDRAQQPHLRFAERVLALVVLDADRAEHAIAAEDRHATRSNAPGRCPACVGPARASLGDAC